MDTTAIKKEKCVQKEKEKKLLSRERGPWRKWEKLRRVRGRGGNTTPVASFWRRTETGCSGGGDEGGNMKENATSCGLIPSRKLGAALWELHHYSGGATLPPPRLRRLKLNRHPPPTSPVAESWRNSRRHGAESVKQHHGSIEENPFGIPTVSPLSYHTSMETARYKHVAKGSNSCLKTSTKLLKVLNRIWALEKQHVADISLIKALKKELHLAHNQLDELIKHITEDKVGSKDRTVDAAVESMRDELDSERKLQRRLARELHELRTSLATISTILEEERKSNEDLRDEFALGMTEKHNESDHDPSILPMSELWLHDQMKAKLQKKTNFEAFVHRRRKNPIFQRSLESIPLNMGEDGGDDIARSDSTYSELEEAIESKKLQQTMKQKEFKERMIMSHEVSPSSLQHKVRNSDREFEEKRDADARHCSCAINSRSHRSMVDYSTWRTYSSPVREWTEKLAPQDLDISKATSNYAIEKHLKTKLHEEKIMHQRLKKASVT